jgi:hypothetical protein
MIGGDFIWFCGLSIFGGLLGSAAASAHRLVRTLPTKILITLLALALTLVVLVTGLLVLGYGYAVAGLVLEKDARIEISQIGNIATYLKWYGAYLTTGLGYFTIVAYGVGLVLCAILQRANRRRAIPLPTTPG